MIDVDITTLIQTTKIIVKCDDCQNEFNRSIKNLKKSRLKFNKDVCLSCACKLTSHKKPQYKSTYWTDKKKKEHSDFVKTSKIFQDGIKNREDNSGIKNPMFGKKHKITTRKKMSISRTGKTGKNATAWKGGKSTITRLVKGFQYRNGWYLNVYKRDGFKCTECGSKHKIEAHHKIPIRKIVDQYKNNFSNNDDLYKFLIKLNIIIDKNLENGITLCRECHKNEHINMGSHNPKVRTK